ncbi:MAG: hydroxylamine oxidase [Deltaproteobacteria bacterium]|nr:hydroxylamine oxidase [Deltaproteobacteria bacterium]
MLLLIVFVFCSGTYSQEIKISDNTRTCLDCHTSLHPGIVGEWEKSAHGRMAPSAAIKKQGMERLVSAEKIPEALLDNVVGCAECHMINPEEHKDSFDHADFSVHPVVTPKDCSVCHSTEAMQYEKNIMYHAYGNLMNNPVYSDLVTSINGIQTFENMSLTIAPPDDRTNADSCLSCHGTMLKVSGTETRETDLGEMDFPVIEGWPNQGVGRINPDGSKGSCASCHGRHAFSMETARKPDACSRCHKGPDVPAYPVYKVSKHGNIYSSEEKSWDFGAVPWTIGKDFSAPTCATCHASLLTDTEGNVVAERSHQMNDRLYKRIFGLTYAHPHPVSPDTTLIRNKAGLPLPTELTGEPVEGFLIDQAEQDKRKGAMQKICLSCHSTGWVEGHFDRLENTITTTNRMTLTATEVLMEAWAKGAANGLDKKESIFNEGIEKKWIEQWLFYANSTRFASAMSGADYGAFDNGRYYLSKNIQDMIEWLKLRVKDKEKK